MSEIKDVGAADPELTTSPIEDEMGEAADFLGDDTPVESVCYFNGKSFPPGSYVKSGASLLKCNYGVWVTSGSSDLDNP